VSEAVTIQKRVIEGEQPGPHLLITGGVHGDEFEPMAAIRRLIKTLTPAPGNLRGKVTLAPVVNEASYNHKHRTADDLKDLARTCPGRPDGSVTERTAHALSELIRTADYYVDLHTGGTIYDILALSGYMMHPNAEVLDAQRKMAKAFNLPIVWGTGPGLDGRSLSVARDANIPGIYTEYGGAAVMQPRATDAYYEGCLNVMGVLDMIDREQPVSAIEHIIEDTRPNTGHLQVQNPAPFAGFFESAVQLGDRVKPGDTLGTVSDVLGDRVETITSTQTGVVLCIHTFCKVDENEGCVVVLETELNKEDAT